MMSTIMHKVLANILVCITNFKAKGHAVHFTKSNIALQKRQLVKYVNDFQQTGIYFTMNISHTCHRKRPFYQLFPIKVPKKKFLETNLPDIQRTSKTYGQKVGLWVKGEQMARCLSADIATTIQIVHVKNIHLIGPNRYGYVTRYHNGSCGLINVSMYPKSPTQ